MTNEQLRGHDESINPHKEKRGAKSHDAMVGLKARVTKVKVIIVDVNERLDRLEEGLKDYIELVDDKLEKHHDQMFEAITAGYGITYPANLRSWRH